MKIIKPKRTRSFSPKFALLAIFLGVGYLSALFSCFGFIPPAPVFVVLVLPYFMMLTVTVIGLYLHLRNHGAQRAIVATEALVFVVLVAWGMGLNFNANTRCIEADCGDLNVYRPLAFPGLLYLSALHAFSVIGYVISRRRPTLLPPKVELLVISSMLLGCILQTTLAVHFGKWVLSGLVFAPLLLPAASPLFALVLFAMQIRARLRQATHALPTFAGATG
jgi:hypothetical protein